MIHMSLLIRYLRVMLDSRLNFKQHVEHVTANAAKVVLIRSSHNSRSIVRYSVR